MINFIKKIYKKNKNEESIKKIDKDDFLKRFLNLQIPEKNHKYNFPIKRPDIMPGVVPDGIEAPVMAMDSAPFNQGEGFFGNVAGLGCFPGAGFPGYPFLSELGTRPEFRALSSIISTEVAREWIKITSQDDTGDSQEKIGLIEQEFKKLDVQGIIQKIAEQDCLFGRGQIFIDIDRADRKIPLVLDRRTIAKGSLRRFVPVEAVWTTPVVWNALDPSAVDFYRPSSWWMLGQEVHASRLLTVITRPVPDLLKAAFNFGGISLSQLALPYVEAFIQIKSSVTELVRKFSTTALATTMGDILQGNSNGSDLFARAQFLVATRDNNGLVLIDRDREELIQVNAPIAGLKELLAQAQEQIASVGRVTLVHYTGLTPSGLNASSEGEIRVFEDFIMGIKESHFRYPIDQMLKVVQLSLFGEIDPAISFIFNPLRQMTAKEKSDIRLQESQASTAYVSSGVISPQEERERLAADPQSGYQGLDVDDESMLIPPMEPGEEDDIHQKIKEAIESLKTKQQSEDEGWTLKNKKAEDKSVSEAQHRAMEAAAHGNSTLDIPKKVGKEFVKKDEE